MFYDIAMNVYKEIEVEDKVDKFFEFLIEKSDRAREYFYDNYFKKNRIQKWAKSYRGNYSMTNNISEALNNKIKRHYPKLNGIRMDSLCHLIMYEISKDFAFETFHGKTIISERSFKYSEINETENSEESNFNSLIRILRNTYNNSSNEEKIEIERRLENFINEL